MQTAGQEPLSREQVQDALDGVFKASEFDQTPSLMEEFIDWFKGLFDFDGFGEGSFEIAKYSLGIVLFVVVLIVVFLFVSHLRRALAEREQAGKSQASQSDLTRDRVAELRAAAGVAEQAGDHLLALRLYFFALVVGLGERGELSYNDAWTNRELLERGTPSVQVAAALQPLVGELDSMSFGERAVETIDVRRFESLCERWLGERVR